MQTVWCRDCKQAFDKVSAPEKCACGGLLTGMDPRDPSRSYALSENDRQLLHSLRIRPEE